MASPNLPKVDPAVAIAAIRDARPPATDRFAYLTILEANLSVEVLPVIEEVLQDAELTQDIGWDLVYNLVNLLGSEACLETIARLGNPREVILKVLETLELLYLGEESGEEGEEGEEEEGKEKGVSKEHKFVTLLGMLAILHRRIKTKYPSRFLAQTLQTVHQTYRPTREATAAVINLVHNLAGRRRPVLPTRKSSINIATAHPERDGDASKNAPDPEADTDGGNGVDEKEDPDEIAMQERLLLSFVTCVLRVYTDVHDTAWASRLLEFYTPERLVPGRRALMAAFREEQELLERDAVLGQLVALVKDLGLDSCSKGFLEQINKGPIINDPLSSTDDAASADDVALSTRGCISIIAYWVFSAAVFDADQPTPDMKIFPDHFALLEKFLQDDPDGQIRSSPGTAEALVAIGLWLQFNGHTSSDPPSKLEVSSSESTSEYMRYLHLVTLVALYHPRLHVRNAATTLAGHILHADPSDEDRIRILYDLLENCTFGSLKACAVNWLREEIIAADPSAQKSVTSPMAGRGDVFTTSQALDTVQYVVFPNYHSLAGLDAQELLEFMSQNAPFLLQAVNFGLFLWSSKRWAHVLPPNSDATVKERWFRPLADAVDQLKRAAGGGVEIGGDELGPLAGDLDVLRERMARLAATEGFKAAEDADRA